MPCPAFERRQAKAALQDRHRDLAVRQPRRRVGDENVSVLDAALGESLTGDALRVNARLLQIENRARSMTCSIWSCAGDWKPVVSARL